MGARELRVDLPARDAADLAVPARAATSGATESAAA